jgi:hypothetical protein
MDVCLNFVSERFLMKRRTFAATTAAILVLSFVFSVFAAVDKKRPVKRRAAAQANPLVALLPASDAVATINGKRFFGEALPKVLSANQKLLGEILAKIDALEMKTGVDLRKFDSFAAGINILKKESNDFDYDPVVVARGAADTASLVENAKKAAEGKYREEIVAGRTVYVFSAADIANQLKNSSTDPNAAVKTIQIKSDIAVSALDGTTIVVGNLNRVRETVEHKTSISAELATLLTRKAPAVINFAGNVPGGMSSLLPLDNDELGANIDSIKTIYGSVDVSAGQGAISVTGRTVQAKQAVDLKGTLEGLRDLGKGLLGGSRGADKKLYARLLANVRITQVANEISLDLTLPQSDIDALVAIFKK